MANTLRWYGSQIQAAIIRESERRLDATGILVTNEVRRLLSVSGTRTSRSRPGEPPRKQLGRLRASYTWERSGLTVRIGTNYQVARILELGSRRMAPRPHLRPALRNATPRINAVWARPMRVA